MIFCLMALAVRVLLKLSWQNTLDRWRWLLRAPLHRLAWGVFQLVDMMFRLSGKGHAMLPPAEGSDHPLRSEALSHLATDLTSSAHDLHRRVVASAVRNADTRRRLLAIRLQQRSTATAPELPPILWIIGLPRTGSTFLHRLLSLSGDVYAPVAWELRHPTEASTGGDEAASRAKAFRRQLAYFYRFAPRLRRIHHITFDGPDECVNAFVDCCFPDWYLWGAIDMPRLHQWYLQTSMLPQYERYKQILQLLFSQFTGFTGRDKKIPALLVLKAPHHIVKLRDIAETFPRSYFLWLHRHPADIVGSCCEMNEAIRDYCSPHYCSRSVLGHRTLHRLAVAAATGVKDRHELENKGVIFFDVPYREVTHDAIACVAKIGELCKQCLSLQEKDLSRWQKRPRDGPCQNRSNRLAAFELTDRDVRSAFREYLDKYSCWLY